MGEGCSYCRCADTGDRACRCTCHRKDKENGMSAAVLLPRILTGLWCVLALRVGRKQ